MDGFKKGKGNVPLGTFPYGTKCLKWDTSKIKKIAKVSSISINRKELKMEKGLQEKIEYCLNCKTKPCQTGCPLQNDISGAIALAKQGEYQKAYELISKTNIMPFICGKVCPTSKQCQGKCVRGIKGKPVATDEIENFIGEMGYVNGWYKQLYCKPKNGQRIAVVGAGPAGITAAMWLARGGYQVTLFEKNAEIGGILRYGIPSFRLDKKWVKALEEQLLYFGVEIQCGKALGQDIALTDLQAKFDQVILAFGANVSCKMNIPGEDLPQVAGANELLETANFPDYHGKCVAVIGGGNVAMDAARTIKRLGAKEVNVVYRRAREQMPAEPSEVTEAAREGISFLFQINVKKIEKNKIYCVRTMLVQADNETRPVPVEIQDSDFTLEADFVVMAIGSKTNNELLTGLCVNDKGYIVVDENYHTNLPNVYAIGDNIGRKATIAWASYFGRECAKMIMKEEL